MAMHLYPCKHSSDHVLCGWAQEITCTAGLSWPDRFLSVLNTLQDYSGEQPGLGRTLVLD